VALGQMNAARLPFRLPEDDQVGAIGPWRRVEEPIMATLQKETNASSSSTATKSKAQQIVGSSTANDLLLGDEEDEKTLSKDIDPDDPDDLRNFRVTEKSHPTEYDNDNDDDDNIYTKQIRKSLNEAKKEKNGDEEDEKEIGSSLFKKRKTTSTASRSRNIRRK
jgi:hypothetical protein